MVIQGGPKSYGTAYWVSGNKVYTMTGISWMGYLLLRTKLYQDQPFWLSGSYSRARYVSQCRVSKIFHFSGKTSPKNPNGTINFFWTRALINSNLL